MVFRRTESHEQDGETLFERMNASTAAGDPAMAFIPLGCERAIHGARSFFGGCLPPHEQRRDTRPLQNRAGRPRADVNGGY